jgi:SprT protein
MTASAHENLVAAIRRRAAGLLRQAAPLCTAHRAALPDPIIRCDLRGQAAGQAIWRLGQRPLLRFNLGIARRHRQDFLERTVAHEVAHLITTACHGRTRPHGREWQGVMAYLGIADPSRCHDYSLDESEVRRQRRWTYACGCSSHELSTTRHNRIQRSGVRYHCRRCGDALRRTPGRRYE